MHIVFKPALSETNHIPTDDNIPTLLNFTATLSVGDYLELKHDGGRVQLWSDIPFEGTPVPYSGWTSCDFGLRAAAGGINLPSVQDISLGLVADDDLPSPGTVVLTLQLLVPNDQRRFSYTYRILYPTGEIKWLGEFGQNGTLVSEHTTTESILGLAAGWTRKEAMYMWTNRSILADIPLLRLAKPDEYLVWTVGGKDGAFLAFITARHNSRPVSVPLEYILCASPTSVMRVRPEKTITVTGDGPLVLSSLPRRQSDFHLLKSMILQHCSPERVAVNLLGQENEYLLITTKDMLPVEGITIAIPTPAHSTPLSIPTDTLRSLLPSQTILTPFLLFAPHTLRAHLVTNVNTVTFTTPGPFVLSPAFNIISRVFVSILSPHKSAQVVEPPSSNLPTPPPSPELVPRLTIPRHHSSFHLYETASSTPEENVALQPVDGENKADNSDTQNGSNANDEIVPRLHLQAVALQAKYIFSIALFVLTLTFKLIFGKSTQNEGAEPKQHVAEDHQSETPEKLAANTVDAQDSALDQKDIHDGADDNVNCSSDSDTNATSRDTVRSLGLASDIDVSRPVAAEPCLSGTLGPESEISKSNSKVLLVEVVGSGTVRLAVWEGEACGVVKAEMNGKRVPVSRMNGSGEAGTRVEFWELTVDLGGMLRICYDHDTAC